VDDKPDPSPEVIAAVVAERFGEAHADVMGPALRQELCGRIEAALWQALRGQSHAHAELCRRRQKMWENTESRPNSPEPLRAEARSRGNEAAYLADAIESAEAPGSTVNPGKT